MEQTTVASSRAVCEEPFETLSTDCRGVFGGPDAFCVVHQRNADARSLCQSTRPACSAQATCDVVRVTGKANAPELELRLSSVTTRSDEMASVKRLGPLQINQAFTSITFLGDSAIPTVALDSQLLVESTHLMAVAFINLTFVTERGLASSLPSGVTSLRMSNTGLTEVPIDLASLSNLRTLSLDSNALTAVTDQLYLPNLVSLNLSANSIQHFAPRLPNIQVLDLSRNALTSLPDTVFTLTALLEVILHDNPNLSLASLTSEQRQFLSKRVVRWNGRDLQAVRSEPLSETITPTSSPTEAISPTSTVPPIPLATTTVPYRTSAPPPISTPSTPPSTPPPSGAVPTAVYFSTPPPTSPPLNTSPPPGSSGAESPDDVPTSAPTAPSNITPNPTNVPPHHSDANSAPIPPPTTTPPPNIEPPLTAPPTPSPEPGTSASPTTQPSMSSSDRDASSSSLGNESQGSSASSPTSASTQTPQPGVVATNESTSDTNHTTLLVTLVVISVAVVVIAAIGILYARRRRRGNNDQHQHQPPTQSQSQSPMQSPAWGLQKATPVTAFAALTTATTGSSKTTDGHSMGTISEDGDELRQRNTEARNLLLSKRVRVGDVDDVCVVGASSSAVVWLVRYRGSRSLASKRLIQERATPQRLAEFVSETVIAAGLDHPSIVLLAGVAWTNQESDLQALYEYMPNGDLQTLLARTPVSHMPWLPDKLHVAIRIAEALVYTHSFDPPLVHRDVRARNVLLGEEWEPKLSNFGSARPVSEENTMTTTGVGSARWLAPEILSGSTSYGVASDVFAFGVLLSELDTHAEPYSDLDVVDVVGSVAGGGVGVGESALLAKVVSGELRPTVLSSCPREVRSVITECVESDASRRPAMVQVVYSLRLLLKYSERG